jgi:hypothetical protein
MALVTAWTQRSEALDPFEEQTVGTMLRVFTDSDDVGVRSLISDYEMALLGGMALSVHWNNERVVIPAIQAPIGSQEAVDAITTASRPISGNAYEDFVKVRNEFQGALTQGGAAVNYYYSTEVDYLAQQLGGSYNLDLMDDRLNVSFGSSYGWDVIEPLNDDDTNTAPDTRTTLHLNTVATQVVSPTTLVRVGVELNVVDGLQHNPYRNVYAGGTNVAERHPDQRQRRDAFLRVNQYLSNRSSIRFNYRFYNDDWGIDSHEVGAKLSQYITDGVFARYNYRWYTQTAADFYSEAYPTTNGIDGYLTGDYRMSPLASHLFGLTLDFDLATLAADSPLWNRLGLWGNYERYFNSNNYSANIFEAGVGFRF